MPDTVHRIPGLVLLDHVFTLPLVHGGSPSDPDLGSRSGRGTGTTDTRTIEVFAREVRSAKDRSPDLGDSTKGPGADARDRPFLVFFQGGPGFGSPRPMERSGWIGKALETHRVLLLDMRGMGRSTPVTHQSLSGFGSAEETAEYLTHFRADSIIRDAEAIRTELAGGDRWSALGQSYGGFCITTYLSLAPEGLASVYVTGGLPPLSRSADEVYRATYQRLTKRNERYYDRYPKDAELMERLCSYLRSHEVQLPGGGPLSVRKLQVLGSRFGMSDGFETVHYILENAFVRGASEEEVAYLFLRDVENALSFETHPIYAILHESIYAQGAATRWSAERIRAEHPIFDPSRKVPYFTGEMVYPWMFEEYPHLVPLRDAANVLAEKADWPALYDPHVLAKNDVPGAAVVYHDDMYVERAFSEETAASIRGMKTWVTSEYDHNGLRADGAKILGKLMDMAPAR
ncbi:MAG: alpha/beta fold hydrolase [Candidatus Eisenbacteria bacterium]